MANTLGSLKIEVLSKTATQEEALKVLNKLCDDDFNGNNGEDYVFDNALKAGFKSNAAYYLDLNLAVLDSPLEAVMNALTAQYESDTDYYKEYQIKTIEQADSYVIATTYLS